MFFKKETKKDTLGEGQGAYVSLDKKVEAILFYKTSEVSLDFLSKTLGEKKPKIQEAIVILKKRLSTSALGVVENNKKYNLTTTAMLSTTINLIKGEENMGELSAPSLETLSIILYKGPMQKSEIDQIRGVNSSYILRNLLIRGLVEKQRRQNGNYYTQTGDLLRFLGITNINELPAYQKVRNILDKIEKDDDEDIEKVKVQEEN